MQNDINSIYSLKKIVPFNYHKRQFELGQWVDVIDTIEQWCEAEVIDLNESQIKVHYNGWSNRWDEWVEKNSQRIQPLRTFTIQKLNSFYQSPTPNKNLDGDFSKIPIKNLDLISTLDQSISNFE